MVLAAGCSARMGREKLLLDLAGEPIIRRVVETVQSVQPAETVVVVNPTNESDISAALAGLPNRVVCNQQYRDGIGSSIAVGAAAVGSSCDAMLLVQGDQPLVTADMLQRLIDTRTKKERLYVAASYDGVTTTPVVFCGSLLPELKRLGGDTGARAVLERHAAQGCTVAFPPACGADLDTEADFQRVRSLWRACVGG